MMFKHYILTRWNKLDDQTSIYNNPIIPDPDEWMEHRMKLFDEITLMSVMLQTERHFEWLMSFDPATPKDILKKYASFPNVHVVFDYPRTYLRNHYGGDLKDGDWIITTRMDNDDYLSPTFIEKVQGQFDETFKLIDTDGRQWDLETDKFYTVERKTCNSPFISLVEQVGVPWQSISTDPRERRLIDLPVKTVMYCSHSKMEWHFPAVKINEVLYRMVIHDRNVCNKIVGYEILQ